MSHLPPLVSDLALILIVAGIVTILFKWLKQPVVLGYIVAGFLVSPNFVLMPSIADATNIATWSEIGIIFLLFALGLEFSFKKLMDVGGTASIATAINMGSMIVIGYIIGQLMGWTQMESIFLGGMLSMSSTTIIIKAFNDMKLQKKRFAGIVFGMLIVEDLAAIVMMVLLSTVAVSQHFEGKELLESVLKLIFFMLIWFVVGIYLIPTLLRKFKKYLNDETLLVVAIGLCLGMVLFADQVGFSAALGAFIMGSILAETLESKRIEHLVEPLKNLFGAVFFVSVGMMIVPSTITEYIGPILLFTAVVLIGRVIFATLGILASGEGLKVSIQGGFSLAQIGEFSFIIATLGMQLGVISDFIYPIIVAVSVITTFTTPYFIKMSTPLYEKLEGHIPSKWNKLITGYAASNCKTINSQTNWNKLLKGVLPAAAIYFALSLAVYFLSQQFLMPLVVWYIPDIWGRILFAVITLLVMAPFMNAIVTRKQKSPEYKALWEDSHFNKAALVAIQFLQIGLCVALILIVLLPLFPKMTPLLLVIAIAMAIFFTFTKGFNKQSNSLESKFFQNLNDKEDNENKNGAVNKQAKDELLNKDIHIEEIEVSPNSPSVGKTLAELNFRQTTGVSIVSIIRGNQKINIPMGNMYLYPYDKIVVAGTDEELQNFMTSIEQRNKNIDDDNTEIQHQINISQYEVEEGSSLVDKTVRELKMQEKTDCMLVGIDRDDHAIAEFSPDTLLQQGDVLWVAGEKENLDKFLENMGF